MLVEQAAITKATELTNFGRYARFVFIYGMWLHMKLNGNAEGMAALQPLMERAYGTIEQGFIKVSRIPYATPYDYALTSMEDEKKRENVNGWFLNYIRDNDRYPADEKDLFKRGIYLIKYAGNSSYSDSTMTWLGNMAKAMSVKLGNAYVTYFAKNIGTPKAADGNVKVIYNGLEEAVKALRKTGTYIPPAELKAMQFTTTNQVQAKARYEQLRKDLKSMTESTLYQLLSNGPLKVKTAEKEFKAFGFRDTPFVTEKDGYTGMIGLDSKGKLAYYSNSGRLLAGAVAPGSKVTMNKKYDESTDDTYFFKFRAPKAVSDTLIYSTKFKNIKNEEKHEKTTAHSDKVAIWIKAWERDLMNKDPMRHVPAAVALLLYLTSARIGTSKENRSLKGGAHTYGISTLRRQHVKVTGASIILNYVGKKGMNQKHVLKLDTKVNKRIATILTRLIKDKKKDDLVFSFPRPTSRTGAIQEVNPTFFRQYLKSVGVTINPHALRHIRGTELARQELESQTWTPTVKAKTLAAKQREAETFMKDKVLTKVANLLGHKSIKNGVEQPAWRTSIQSYVQPSLISQWFKDKRLTVPKWVPSKLEE